MRSDYNKWAPTTGGGIICHLEETRLLGQTMAGQLPQSHTALGAILAALFLHTSTAPFKSSTTLGTNCNDLNLKAYE